ncbi:MAG TPA: hypothetical protein IAC65_08195 [Candidatus Aphodousia faecipullorum]|nr:hypothetical protein [Candidatus Aphodousia faecipullorum]
MPFNFKTLTPLILLGVLFSHAQAKAIPEALGPVYPVIEPDILALLQKHAAESEKETQKRLSIAKDRFKALLQNPEGRALPRATCLTVRKEPVSEWVSASIDAAYRRDWLFVDGEENADIDLARSFILRHPLPQGRVIAVNGSIAALQEALQTRVWFDQKGVLIQRLQIHELPAWVTFTAQTIEVKTGSTEALLPLVTQTPQGPL